MQMKRTYVKLRPHQLKDYKQLKKALKRYDRVLLGASVGYGKSILMSHLTAKLQKKGKRVLVTVPRLNLIPQMEKIFNNFNILFSSTHTSRFNPKAQVILSTPQTVNRRGDEMGKFDVAIFDEAHLFFNISDPDNPPQGIKNIIPLARKWVGFSATPITANGYRLEGWEHTIYNHDTAWLINKGWLANFDYYAVPSVDPASLRIDSRSGEYVTSEVEQLTNTATAVQAVHDAYTQYCKGKKTVIYAASITHAELVKEHFSKEDIGIVHSMMSKKQLKEVYAADHQILVNVNILTTGYDDPELECIIYARPIGSTRTHIQVCGRVLRHHKNIPVVRIVDLCNVYETTGVFPDDKINWNRERSEQPILEEGEERENRLDVVMQCPSCKQEIRTLECKRQTMTSPELVVTTYFCPKCDEVCKEISKELMTPEKLQKLKTAKDIDWKKTYTLAEVTQLLGELIKQNTRNAKTSWGHYIHKTCMENDKQEYEAALRAYDQKIFSSRKSWKKIMGIYES